MEIPWARLLTERCKIYVENLHLSVAHTPRPAKPDDEDDAKDDSAAGAQEEGVGRGRGRKQFKMSQSFYKERQEAGSRGYAGYGEEGVERLSKMVQHVLGNTEVCVKNLRLSLFAQDPRDGRFCVWKRSKPTITRILCKHKTACHAVL